MLSFGNSNDVYLQYVKWFICIMTHNNDDCIIEYIYKRHTINNMRLYFIGTFIVILLKQNKIRYQIVCLSVSICRFGGKLCGRWNVREQSVKIY